jgi:two-component system phosphate regulon sensor histidine kinase PhoR
VELLWFLSGLTIGLVLLGWQSIRLNWKLNNLLRGLNSDTVEVSLSTASRLSMAIAQQKQSQAELERQVQFWGQILQNAPIAYLQVDDENQLVWCNEVACTLLHLQRVDTTRPRLLLELVRSYELDQLIERTRSAQQNCQQDWTFYPTSADPSKLLQQVHYPLRGYGFPLHHGEVGVFLENRQEAINLLQQRDRWTSDVAHELKTPLTSIRLVAETLQSRLEPPLRDWVDRLLQEVLRLSNLVQDLLDLSQLDLKSGRRLSLRTIDLVKLIHAAWFNLEPLARKKSLQLKYIGPEQLLLEADETRLYQVLINLLDNSLKYSPPQQRIRVQLSLEETLSSMGKPIQQAYLEIVDAGPGFAETDLPFVFERFYRADSSRARHIFSAVLSSGLASPPPDRPLQNLASKDRPNSTLGLEHPARLPSDPSPEPPPPPTTSGSGLGLAIVRQIIEAHQGQVEAANHPDTGGAWLQIFLPLRQSDTHLN